MGTTGRDQALDAARTAFARHHQSTTLILTEWARFARSAGDLRSVLQSVAEIPITIVVDGDPYGAVRLQQLVGALERTTVIRWLLAETLVQIGLYDGHEEALQQASSTIDHLTRLGRGDHLATFSKRITEAIWTAQAGFDVPFLNGSDDSKRHEVDLDFGSVRAHCGRASQLGQPLIVDLERVLGPEHPFTIRARSAVAGWLFHAGDHAGALAQYQVLLPLVERVMGAEHTLTLVSRHGLASGLAAAGDKAGAIVAFQELLATLERLVDADDPLLMSVRANLAVALGQATTDPPWGMKLQFKV